MRFLKKYTVMFVPFNQEKVLKFNVTNLGVFFILTLVFFMISLTMVSVFSDQNIFTLNEKRINNLYVRDTLSVINDKFALSEENYQELKKDIRDFLLAYYPNFHQRYSVDDAEISMMEDVDFLVKILGQFSDFYQQLNGFFSDIPSIFPVVGGGHVTSGFGPRTDPFTLGMSFHTGVDIPKFPGTPVRAAASGKVIFANWNPSYGFLVRIQHPYGFSTRYAHMIAPPLVLEGDEVKQGQIVGHVGSTGRSVGYHLHYEVRNTGKILNPELYLFLKK